MTPAYTGQNIRTITKQKDELADRRGERLVVLRMDGLSDGLTDRQTGEGLIVLRMDGLIDRQTDGQGTYCPTDGWID